MVIGGLKFQTKKKTKKKRCIVNFSDRVKPQFLSIVCELLCLIYYRFGLDAVVTFYKSIPLLLKFWM